MTTQNNQLLMQKFRVAQRAAEGLSKMGVTLLSINIGDATPTIETADNSNLRSLGGTKITANGESCWAVMFGGCRIKWQQR